MARKKRLTLKRILSKLEEIANKVRTNHQAVERQLKECGYVVPKNGHHPDGVMKVLTVAVVEAVQQKVDLKKVDPEDMKNYNSKKLAKLLGVKSLHDRHGFLKNKVKKNQLLQKAKSPRDMAKYTQRQG